MRLSTDNACDLNDLLKSWRNRIQRDRLHMEALLPLLREQMPGVPLTEQHVRDRAKFLKLAIPRRPRTRRELGAEPVPPLSPAELQAAVEAARAKADDAIALLEKVEETLRSVAAPSRVTTASSAPPW